ncbi:hypothetical protein VHEMI08346 [[Torrubiella] hemipterigena]|uniref:EGF-like domain-containing protein n=1 Tax=[Torrubiella] hemipterigena TaxID=1531966 RepID=A0A0A1T6J1_9HYPO|nr:hypothetical protein VHEMI08346 [[Torrubiella] hemipterigena]
MAPWNKLVAFGALFAVANASCSSDEDCSLNGVCSPQGTCACDKGWVGADCGVVDTRPAHLNTGYNLTASGTSSWGSKIVQDPTDKNLHHLFAAEFSHGCGLDYWAPYSRIIRAESRTGPAGPYSFAAEIQPAFAHNPTVVYSPADKQWLMYYIGCKQKVVTNKCTFNRFTCGPGNANNGESGLSVMSSWDLKHWYPHGQVFKGDNSSSWDADVTNPTVFPLHKAGTGARAHASAGSGSSNAYASAGGEEDPGMLLVYRGCPYDCGGAEQINVAVSPTGYLGPYTKIGPDPIFENGNEDPFVWRDKRGNWHMLLHSLEADGGFGNGPKVGRHAFARDYKGPWTFVDRSLAFSTEVKYSDGSTIDFFRRERPQLYFSDDGEMTPLFMTTGVQPRNNPMSYTVIVPIGDDGVKAQG